MLTNLQVRFARAAAALASVSMLIITVMLVLAQVLLLAHGLSRCYTVLAALTPVSEMCLDGPASIAARGDTLGVVAGVAGMHAVLSVSKLSP